MRLKIQGTVTSVRRGVNEKKSPILFRKRVKLLLTLNLDKLSMNA